MKEGLTGFRRSQARKRRRWLATAALIILPLALMAGLLLRKAGTRVPQQGLPLAERETGREEPASAEEIRGLWGSLDPAQQEELAGAGLGLEELLGMAGRVELGRLRERLENEVEYQAYLRRHAPGVLVGDALGWRPLADLVQLELQPDMLICGNFDDDPQQEVLLRGSRCLIADISGEISEPGGLQGEGLVLLGCWDMDGDGRDELLAYRGTDSLIPAAGGNSLATQVLDRNGMSLATLSGGILTTLDGRIVMDRSGFRSLLLQGGAREGPAARLLAYGAGGRPVWQGNSVPAQGILALGDFDGDGMEELLFGSSDPARAGRLLECSAARGISELASPLTADQALLAVPLDGNTGCGILCGTEIRARDGRLLAALQHPPLWQGMVLAQDSALHSARGGRLAALIKESVDYYDSDTLATWDSAGRLLHLEHFAGMIHELQLLTGPDGERLVLRSDSEVLLSEPL